jgi:hypothetical protein
MNELKKIFMDFGKFVSIRKKYWLLPLVLLLVLLAIVTLFSHPAGMAPLIYSIF